jgi:glycine cleavage system pyridoxal-binding protein P
MKESITRLNQNFNIPDSIFQYRNNKWRAGSKRQDFASLGGIVMAWQVGLTNYKQKMKVNKDRFKQIKQFIGDTMYNSHIRRFVERSMLESEECTTLTELLMLFSAYQAETDEHD